jgi:hypothetical protein
MQQANELKKVRKQPSDYLKLNKKKTKVKMTGLPKVMGISGFAVQAGLPFGYLAYRYDLFTFEQAGYAITGWGVVAVASILMIFRKSIKATLQEAEGSLGVVYQRSKLGNTMLILAGIVLLTNYFVEAFVVLFAVIAGATYVSLPFYKLHDEVNILKKEMQEELKKRNTQSQLESKIANL